MTIHEITDAATWDTFVAQHPFGHPLQLWGWGEAKRGNLWEPRRLAWMDGATMVAAAQVLLWPIPRTGRYVAYVPRGPVIAPDDPRRDELLAALTVWAGQNNALYLRIEPAWLAKRVAAIVSDASEATANPDIGDESVVSMVKLAKNWRRAAHTLQLPETFTIDLKKSEAAILLPMSRKHRQYIRKAERESVVVTRETTGNLGPMYDIYSQTARRAGFGIHTEEYYMQLYAGLGELGQLYYAAINDQPVAFLWLATAGGTAYELYGGVTTAGQEAKANYYLKWAAIQAAQTSGANLYDFNGRLNEGVSRFKEGFGADETDWIGTWDYPLHELGYHLWEKLWPVAKPIGRRIMKAVKR